MVDLFELVAVSCFQLDRNLSKTGSTSGLMDMHLGSPLQQNSCLHWQAFAWETNSERILVLAHAKRRLPSQLLSAPFDAPTPPGGERDLGGRLLRGAPGLWALKPSNCVRQKPFWFLSPTGSKGWCGLCRAPWVCLNASTGLFGHSVSLMQCHWLSCGPHAVLWERRTLCKSRKSIWAGKGGTDPFNFATMP